MSSESTQILPQAGALLPGAPSAINLSESERCPHCSATIPSGEEFCPLCGYQRGSWALAAGISGIAASTAAVKPPAQAVSGRFILRAVDGTGYHIPDGETVAGRGDVALRLDDGFISRQHARFAAGDSGLTVTDLGSSNGSFVNGEQLAAQAEHALEPGDTLKLGNLELSVEANPAWGDATVALTADAAAEEAADDPAEEAAAEVVAPAAASGWSLSSASGLHFALALGESSCGRREGNTIVIPDGFVSGLHCLFNADADGLTVSDQGSTNGTFVNGTRLDPQQAAALSTGDLLRLGQLELTVEFAAGAAANTADAVADESAPEEPAAADEA